MHDFYIKNVVFHNFKCNATFFKLKNLALWAKYLVLLKFFVWESKSFNQSSAKFPSRNIKFCKDMWQVLSIQNIIYILQLPKQWWLPGIFFKSHFVMRLIDQLTIIFVKWLPALKVFHHSCLAALRELCTMDSISTITFAGVFFGKKSF